MPYDVAFISTHRLFKVEFNCASLNSYSCSPSIIFAVNIDPSLMMGLITSQRSVQLPLATWSLRFPLQPLGIALLAYFGVNCRTEQTFLQRQFNQHFRKNWSIDSIWTYFWKNVKPVSLDRSDQKIGTFPVFLWMKDFMWWYAFFFFRIIMAFFFFTYCYAILHSAWTISKWFWSWSMLPARPFPWSRKSRENNFWPSLKAGYRLVQNYWNE